MEINKNNEFDSNEELEMLFKFVPPEQLKKSLHEVYSFYLQNPDITFINPDFNKIAMDVYFLYKFLEKAEEKESLKNK